MDKEDVSYWNGVHEGLILAEGEVAEIKGQDNLAAIQAIRDAITKVEEVKYSIVKSSLRFLRK